MRTNRDTAVVVPCFNEAERLDIDAFLLFLATDTRHVFIFVDDGSTDETQRVLQALAQREPDRISVCALESNRGKAEAVRRGLLQAIEIPEVSRVGYWDADLATPLGALHDFAKFFDAVPSCRWLLGSRVLMLGRAIVRRPARHYAGRGFATLASMLLGLPVYDTQCGAKLFVIDNRLRACLADPFMTGWIFDVELIARYMLNVGSADMAPHDGLYELPLREWRDVSGSKVRSRDFVKAIGELARLGIRYGGPLSRARRQTRRIPFPGPSAPVVLE